MEKSDPVKMGRCSEDREMFQKMGRCFRRWGDVSEDREMFQKMGRCFRR